jgi:hypothetical protein
VSASTPQPVEERREHVRLRNCTPDQVYLVPFLTHVFFVLYGISQIPVSPTAMISLFIMCHSCSLPLSLERKRDSVNEYRLTLSHTRSLSHSLTLRPTTYVYAAPSYTAPSCAPSNTCDIPKPQTLNPKPSSSLLVDTPAPISERAKKTAVPGRGASGPAAAAHPMIRPPEA